MMMSMRNFLSIVLLFAVIFVMFMFVTFSSDRLAAASVNERANEETSADKSSALLDGALNETGSQPGTISAGDNPQAAIVVSGYDDAMADVLTEWCVYNKYRYRIFVQLPGADELSGYNAVLFGTIEIKAGDVPLLRGYAGTGVPMVFTRLPAYTTLEKSPALADFFGIAQCVGPFRQLDGVKIFADFFLSKERIYADDDAYGILNDMAISVPYYTLRAGYDVYATGLLNDQTGIPNEKLPALLWRTYTGSSQVFVVNSTIFDGKAMLGVVTAFLSQASDCYLYPVINSQTIVVTDYPCFSNDNAAAIMARYSRDTEAFCRDILWPNIVKILNNYKSPFNFFVSPRLDYETDSTLLGEDVIIYWKEIRKLSGVAGLSLGQMTDAPLQEVLSKDDAFFRNVLPSYRFTALFQGSFSDDALRSGLSAADPDGFLGHVTLALSAYNSRKRLFSYLDDKVLSVMMTQDGYQHESSDDIQMMGLETALGLCVQHADLSRALYPAGDSDDWSQLSKLWSQGNTYFNDFTKFDSTTVYELETRVRNFLAMNFHTQKTENGLRVSIDNFSGEAWFVLRVHQARVKSTQGCTAQRLSDTAYLIKASAAEPTIELQETDTLGPPERE